MSRASMETQQSHPSPWRSLSLQLLVHELAAPRGFRAVAASSRHTLVLGEGRRKEMLKGREVTCYTGLYFQESKAFLDTPADYCF